MDAFGHAQVWVGASSMFLRKLADPQFKEQKAMINMTSEAMRQVGLSYMLLHLGKNPTALVDRADEEAALYALLTGIEPREG